MKIKRLKEKKFALPVISALLTLALLGFFIFINKEPASAPTSDQQKQETNAQANADTQPDTTKEETKKPEVKPDTPQTTPEAGFNKEQYSLSDPSSLWVVVNKKRPLPSSYTPNLVSTLGGQMRSEASTNLINLVNAAKQAGHNLYVISSYRSYSTQQSTYNGWVSRDGQAQADTYSARPGHSEHQTGLAVDLGGGSCDLETCFGNTQAGIWIKNNAASYGFIIRYPSGKDSITGYQYEPWHLRYVGMELSTEISKTSDQTMEEFFGLSAAPGY